MAELNNAMKRLGLMFHRTQIREVAYGLWEDAGRPEGDGKEFWYAAEEKVRKGRQQFEKTFNCGCPET